MMNPTTITNGGSLEDCHTNFFALTDLCGIRWRKFVHNDPSTDPLNDPVLRSYAKCLQVNILSVWRRIPSKKNDIYQSHLYDHRMPNTVTYPPLSLKTAKELWIFWYGEEPVWNDILVPELVKNTVETAEGSWEGGINYDVRSLLFKSLHNLIERCLLSRGVVRLGKWFVQPCTRQECSLENSFFVHGESTVCTSMDLRIHPNVRKLTHEHLKEAALNSDYNQFPVILAPFGVAATLTGKFYRTNDTITKKTLKEWSIFYPLLNRTEHQSPPVVEVIAGGVKMYYPARYVLISDTDNVNFSFKTISKMLNQDECNEVENENKLTEPIELENFITERVWQECVITSQLIKNNTNLMAEEEVGGSSNSSNEKQTDFENPANIKTCNCPVRESPHCSTHLHNQQLISNLMSSIPTQLDSPSSPDSSPYSTYPPSESPTKCEEQMQRSVSPIHSFDLSTFSDTPTEAIDSQTPYNFTGNNSGTIPNTEQPITSSPHTSPNEDGSSSRSDIDTIKKIKTEPDEEMECYEAKVKMEPSLDDNENDGRSMNTDEHQQHSNSDRDENIKTEILNSNINITKSETITSENENSLNRMIMNENQCTRPFTDDELPPVTMDDQYDIDTSNENINFVSFTTDNELLDGSAAFGEGVLALNNKEAKAGREKRKRDDTEDDDSDDDDNDENRNEYYDDDDSSDNDDDSSDSSESDDESNFASGKSKDDGKNDGDEMNGKKESECGEEKEKCSTKMTTDKNESDTNVKSLKMEAQKDENESNLIDGKIRSESFEKTKFFNDNKSIDLKPERSSSTDSCAKDGSANDSEKRSHSEPNSRNISPKHRNDDFGSVPSNERMIDSGVGSNLSSVPPHSVESPLDKKNDSKIKIKSENSPNRNMIDIALSSIHSDADKDIKAFSDVAALEAALTDEHQHGSPELNLPDPDNLESFDAVANLLELDSDDNNIFNALGNDNLDCISDDDGVHLDIHRKQTKIETNENTVKSENQNTLSLGDSFDHLLNAPIKEFTSRSSENLNNESSAMKRSSSANEIKSDKHHELTNKNARDIKREDKRSGDNRKISSELEKSKRNESKSSRKQSDSNLQKPDLSSDRNNNGDSNDRLSKKRSRRQYCESTLQSATQAAVYNVERNFVNLEKRPSLQSNDYENLCTTEEEPNSRVLYDYSTLEAWMNHPVKRFKADTVPSSSSKTPSKPALGELYSHQNVIMANWAELAKTQKRKSRSPSPKTPTEVLDSDVSSPEAEVPLSPSNISEFTPVEMPDPEDFYNLSEEYLQEWSYVSPTSLDFYGSSKYAPLNDIATSNDPYFKHKYVYRPSWERAQNTDGGTKSSSKSKNKNKNKSGKIKSSKKNKSSGDEKMKNKCTNNETINTNLENNVNVGNTVNKLTSVSDSKSKKIKSKSKTNDSESDSGDEKERNKIKSSNKNSSKGDAKRKSSSESKKHDKNDSKTKEKGEEISEDSSPFFSNANSDDNSNDNSDDSLNASARKDPNSENNENDDNSNANTLESDSTSNTSSSNTQPTMTTTADTKPKNSDATATKTSPSAFKVKNEARATLPDVCDENSNDNADNYDECETPKSKIVTVHIEHDDLEGESATKEVSNAGVLHKKCKRNIDTHDIIHNIEIQHYPSVDEFGDEANYNTDSGYVDTQTDENLISHFFTFGDDDGDEQESPNESDDSDSDSSSDDSIVSQYTPTALPPLSPYGTAPSSPLSTTSSCFGSMENIPPPAQRLPETNALIMNLLLYDTSMNLFRDHNFDSCSLCVCSTGQGRLGNIRGSESSFYSPMQQAQNGTNQMMNANDGSLSFMGATDENERNRRVLLGNNAYTDNDPVYCNCGFSTMMNRKLSYRSGLFYDDENEITGIADDPYAKAIERLGANCDETAENADEALKVAQQKTFDGLTQLIMEYIQEQCTCVVNTASSTQRAIRSIDFKAGYFNMENAYLNFVEYSDAQTIITMALNSSRLESPYRFRKNQIQTKSSNAFVNVHKWPYIKTGIPQNNKDFLSFMKKMVMPILKKSFNEKYMNRWEAPTMIQGPLTWRQFHRMASTHAGQCEPQPIPSIVVGHEKDWLSLSPYAIQYWDQLALEPYSYARDVAYIVIAPDNKFIVDEAKQFFKELSTTYEMCKLGRHSPIKGFDGILCAEQPSAGGAIIEELEELYKLFDDNKTIEILKSYAHTCMQHLVPYLTKIANDKSIFDPEPEGFNIKDFCYREKSLASPLFQPDTPESTYVSEKEQIISFDNGSSGTDCDLQMPYNNTSTPTPAPTPPTPTANEPLCLAAEEDEEDVPPCIIVYILNPLPAGYESDDVQRLACIALLRCYSNILSSVPDNIRNNIKLQIIAMESILDVGKSGDCIRLQDEMRCIALSIFSQSKRSLCHDTNTKILTGFGTAANLQMFIKNKDCFNRAPFKLYTPPYILSGREEVIESTEVFAAATIDMPSSVLYCNYCLSEDQKWLLAVVTDERGEMLETVSINIELKDYEQRETISIRRQSLQKLLDFIIGVISQTSLQWRIVIGRIGRIGHGELKAWSWLLSKQNLVKTSKQLKEVCGQCSMMYLNSCPSIVSACLLTLEPDSNFRLFSDQFTPDERFSQISMQSTLCTPTDLTCTHILVLPVNAMAQSVPSFPEHHIADFNEEELFVSLSNGGKGTNNINTMNGINNGGSINGVSINGMNSMNGMNSINGIGTNSLNGINGKTFLTNLHSSLTRNICLDAINGIDGLGDQDGLDGAGLNNINGLNDLNGINSDINNMNGIDGIDGMDAIEAMEGMEGMEDMEGMADVNGIDDLFGNDWDIPASDDLSLSTDNPTIPNLESKNEPDSDLSDNLPVSMQHQLGHSLNQPMNDVKSNMKHDFKQDPDHKPGLGLNMGQSMGLSGNGMSDKVNQHCDGIMGQANNGEQIGQILQQPLAIGFMVSTAPIGRMPPWFWSNCPHLENVNPVFLKSSLHLHSPLIYQNTNEYINQHFSQSGIHPLDSPYTTDTMRYILEGYNFLSWLSMDQNTNDRISCLPFHIQVLIQLYHMVAAFT